ncbi:MAG: SAM-dependent methyltransferase [Bacteroidetes bacterium GWA2_32_17]|nr:MAG: SAM-dependent methyltransferase [Bacteroidetes bacterium GWA2_32_17]
MRKFIKFIVRNIPRTYLIKFSRIFSFIIVPFYKGNNVECPICNGKFRKFLPYGNKGDNNRLCPKCLSLERHRLLWLYLNNKTDFFTAKLKVLHIAPEQSFIKRFKKLTNLEYITADLESPLAALKMNIKDIPFNGNTFDVLICNHVLEHIDDEPKALSEALRVLKPNGWAILQVPINNSFETTYEDASITSPKEREKHFGQYDHVRFHGKDYPLRLQSAGFKVVIDEFVKHFSSQDIERYRLSTDEIIYFCIKP